MSQKENFPSIEGLSDDDAIPVIIEELEKIEDKDAPSIHGMEGISTVNVLIGNIRRKTPQGLKVIEMWRQTGATLKDLAQKKESDNPGALSKLRRGLRNALERLLNK